MSRVIGLTGGIASGKTTVAEMLGALGAHVVDADQLARRVVEVGSPALHEIKAAFGEAMIAKGGELDRARLGELVFADAQARDRLNQIVHPRVMELSREEIQQAQRSGARLVVYDVPLLFEAERAAEFDGVLVVWVSPQVQVLRLRQRAGLDEAAARARIEAQMPLGRKRELARWVIDNSGSRERTRLAVGELWDTQLALSEPG